MFDRTRWPTLLTAGLALAAIVLLAAGLAGFELRPGRLFVFPGASALTPDANAPLGDGLLFAIWRALVIVPLALSPIAILVLIVSPRFRRQVLRILMILALVYVMGYILLMGRQRAAPGDGLLPDQPAPTQTAEAEIIGEFEARLPDWLVFAISLGLLALPIAAVWLMWRRARPPAGPLEQVAQEARQAIEDLRAGGDVKDVVMRCYLEMSQVVSVQRGIRRQAAMTPREFEWRLESVGLPAEPVRRLTRLFEGVRYGAKTAGEREQSEAIACLTAIIRASGLAA
jgi:hypothetical protein